MINRELARTNSPNKLFLRAACASLLITGCGEDKQELPYPGSHGTIIEHHYLPPREYFDESIGKYREDFARYYLEFEDCNRHNPETGETECRYTWVEVPFDIYNLYPDGTSVERNYKIGRTIIDLP